MKKPLLIGIATAVFAGIIAAAVALVDVGTPRPPASAPSAPLPGTPEIDLLALVDPARDAVKGAWTLESGRLVSDDDPASRLELPYVLPEEYSFTVEFVRRSGTGGVHLILTRGGTPFVCPVGDDGRGPEDGRVHLATVEVRKDRVTAHVDNRKVLEWRTGQVPGMNEDWRLRQAALPGVGTSGSPTEFRKIRLFEVLGRGRALRPRGK